MVATFGFTSRPISILKSQFDPHLLMNQLSVSTPKKAQIFGLCHLHWSCGRSNRILTSAWSRPVHCSHLGNKPVDRRFLFLSLLLTEYFFKHVCRSYEATAGIYQIVLNNRILIVTFLEAQSPRGSGLQLQFVLFPIPPPAPGAFVLQWYCFLTVICAYVYPQCISIGHNFLLLKDINHIELGTNPNYCFTTYLPFQNAHLQI